jgi:predicted transcriptional regulator
MKKICDDLVLNVTAEGIEEIKEQLLSLRKQVDEVNEKIKSMSLVRIVVEKKKK